MADKKIGITCDDYKANKWRKRLQKEGYSFTYDGASELLGIHIFQITVPAAEFDKESKRLERICRELQLAWHRSN